MAEVKKPLQEKITVWGKEYTIQRLPALDAFMAREELSLGNLVIHLIDNMVVHPNIKAADMENANEIRDLGVELVDYQYQSEEEIKSLEKKSKGK